MNPLYLTALLVLLTACSEPKATELSCVEVANQKFSSCMKADGGESCTSKRLEEMRHCGRDVPTGKPLSSE